MKTHLLLNFILYLVCQISSMFAILKSGGSQVLLLLISGTISYLLTRFYMGNKNLINEHYGIYEY